MKLKHPKINLLILLLSFNCFVFGQTKNLKTGSVQGIIIDAETKKNIEVATVELLQKSDTTLVKGTITDQDGRYEFKDIPFGKYLLRASFMGYHHKFINTLVLTPENPTQVFSKSALIPDTKELGEVSIMSTMLTGTIEDNKTIYMVNSKAAQMAMSGLDLLRHIPDCDVDFMDKSVTIEGNTNILFMVNGKRVSKDYLEQLNPILIEKYETTTNPGVEYDSDIDAVINVILKKDIDFGMSARLSTDIPTSKTHFGNGNANIDFFRKNIRVFAGGRVSFNQWEMHTEETRKTHLNNGQDNIQETNSEFLDTGRSGGINFGSDYYLNDNNTLNVTGNINLRFPVTNERTSYRNVYNTGLEDIAAYTNYYKQRNDYLNQKYSLFYKHDFEKKGHELSAELSYSENENENKNEYIVLRNGLASDAPAILSQNQVTQNNQQTTGVRLDYKLPITDKINLTSGIYNYNAFSDNSFNEKVKDYYGKINYDEWRTAAYTNMSYKIKKTYLQAGVRFENSKIDIREASDTTNSYHEFLPFVSAKTEIGKRHSLRLNYRKSIGRPGLNQINPFNYKEDTYSQSSGNPNLNPSDYHKFEITHKINIKGPLFVVYKPYIRYQTNGIARVISALNDSVTMTNYQNVNNSLEYGVKINGNFPVAKWWNISPGFSYYHINIEDNSEFSINGWDNSSWSLNINNRFSFPKDWNAFVNFRKQGPIYSFQQKQEKGYMVFAGVSKRYKKCNFSIFTLNPFLHEYVFDKNTKSSENLDIYSKRAIHYSHVVNFRFSYSFNKGKQIKKLEKQMDTEPKEEQDGGVF